ncbi:RsmB/NOP family class I SAM-dependent RNA methyltransferase [Alloscardovia criceti]|uniref:RsmB/NOP family class I SAM-dependent RNA methyltransferase n=1 Tax=Alloscardovia criceti TaxID=356828 RepID=UPI000372AB63|nr:transcription antitermination factor NusB [Alloscardovia criceti]
MHNSHTAHARGPQKKAKKALGKGTRTPKNARTVAYEVLSKLETNDGYANLLLPHTLKESGLSAQDKSFVTDAVYGTLRWRLFLDAVIEAAHKKPLKTVNTKLVNILRLGAYQWLFMGGAAHASVNETVNLARKKVGAQTSGFVNALMRKIVAVDRHQWEVNITSRMQPAQFEHAEDLDIARKSVRFSHPQWIIREFISAWQSAHYAWSSESGDPINALLAADNAAPAVTLCVRPGLAEMDEVYDQVEGLGGTAVRGELSPYALRVRGVNPHKLSAVRAGTVGVEDEGSQIAALMLALAPIQHKHKDGNFTEEWLDMCAGPGGKTALLASYAAQSGARISANEPHEHRRELVRDNLKAIPEGTVAEIYGMDGTQFGHTQPEKYDRILVDAPCSGLGALRRRPEARWRKEQDTIEELVELQKNLLVSALHAVKPGGIVAYVTCSPVLAETRDIVDDALAAMSSSHMSVERLDVPSIMTQLNARIPVPEALENGQPQDMQLFEHIHDTDQMFISVLRKAL